MEMQDPHINLKVNSQEGEAVFFRIKHTTVFEKFMKVYCERQSLNINSVDFVFDGRVVLVDETPDELGMEDGDEIEVRRN